MEVGGGGEGEVTVVGGTLVGPGELIAIIRRGQTATKSRQTGFWVAKKKRVSGRSGAAVEMFYSSLLLGCLPAGNKAAVCSVSQDVA